jgi:hypothetical protein
MILADSGFWVALANRRDAHHELAQARLAELREPLATTWPVMTETCHLLLHRLGVASQTAFIAAFRGGAFTAFALTHGHARRIEELLRQYESLPMDLADASLVILAEHLGHGRILTTDRRDFGAYRWKDHAPFTNLLLA